MNKTWRMNMSSRMGWYITISSIELTWLDRPYRLTIPLNHRWFPLSRSAAFGRFFQILRRRLPWTPWTRWPRKVRQCAKHGISCKIWIYIYMFFRFETHRWTVQMFLWYFYLNRSHGSVSSVAIWSTQALPPTILGMEKMEALPHVWWS